MDTTTAIIVVLFVVTILSSLGNKGYIPPSAAPKEAIFTKATIGAKVAMPDPTYFEVVGESPRKSIKQYISKYRTEKEAEDITASIMRYSQAYNLNPKLVAALIARESKFNPSAVSKSGAVGLGQLLPSTWSTVGISNPYDIDENVKGTVRYLKYLLDRFKKYRDRVALAIAAYLEGPNAIERSLSYKIHTQAYINDIIDIYHKI